MKSVRRGYADETFPAGPEIDRHKGVVKPRDQAEQVGAPVANVRRKLGQKRRHSEGNSGIAGGMATDLVLREPNTARGGLPIGHHKGLVSREHGVAREGKVLLGEDIGQGDDDVTDGRGVHPGSAPERRGRRDFDDGDAILVILGRVVVISGG